jgi:hypothetical protein
MLLSTDYYDPTDLTGYVRAALYSFAINRFILSGVLPDRPIDDLEYRFLAGGQGLADAASFRAYDAESQIGSRPGMIRKSGELPPVSRKLRLGEYDRLRQRTDPQAQIALGIENDAARLALGIAARMELARGDALVNGSVTISENGIQAEIEFGRSSEAEVTAGILWTDTADADPISDLVAWCLAYVEMNGVDPGNVIFSRQVMANLSRTESLRRLVANVIGEPAIVSQATVTQLFNAFGLPPFVTYDAQVNVGGVATRIIPPEVVLLVPPIVATDDFEGTELGATFWGTTAESLEPNYGLAEEDRPGIVAGVYSDEDPVALWTKASAIGLPILANPNLAWVGTVG